MEKVKIFLSYCWKDSNVADKIYNYFKRNQNIELHRDTIDIGTWGSIKEYMHSINKMDYTILLISDFYLKSVNCMYEVLEVMRDRNYKDKIFPAVIYSEIYNPIARAKYVKYWQDEFRELENGLKEIDLQNLGKLHEDLKRRRDISSNIADFMDMVSDMNNPNIEDVCIRIEEKLKTENILIYKQMSSVYYKSKIVVVGVGGEGNNVINRMIDEIIGVEFIGVDTNKQALELCKASKLLQIGGKLTKGLDAGAKPEIGEKAAEESSEDIKESLKGADIAFVICGMGGATGSGAAPVIVRLAKNMGILTIGVVTKPFKHEKIECIKNSIIGINKMEKNVDSLIVFSRNKILEFVYRYPIILNVNEIVSKMCIQLIDTVCDLINIPCLINLDIEDLRTVMKDKGIIYIGLGHGKGMDKVEEAFKMAINSPFLETTLDGATYAIIYISGDISIFDANDAASYVQELVGEDINVIFGAMYTEELEDSCTITLIATGRY